MIRTACGLDCPDACGITTDPAHFPKMAANTNTGTLCSLLNRDMFKTPRIEKPSINGMEVTMDEALDAAAKALGKSSLLWRGSGNFGVMQEITDLLFEKIGGTLTKGSLCDGAGNAGILEGRGINRTLPPEQVEKADVVVVWGRNPTTTNTHMMPYLEGKKIVVIDPVRTALAKKADLHLQIKPRSDFYLAIMLARFTFMEDSEDIEWMDEFASEYEDFYDFTREFRIKAILAHIGLNLNDMGDLLGYLQKERVVILVGNGVQKYSIGHFVLWAIDSLAATLGLYGKEGCGVGYLGNSKLGFDNPFDVKCKRVSKATAEFSSFDTILVQGGNPAESLPDSNRVIEELESVENLIYFGLYENETSKRAKIVIPAKNFFEKEDVRLSYGHHDVRRMNRVIDSEIGISEYTFAQKMLERLGLEGLKEEQYYIDCWLDQCRKNEGEYQSPAYEAYPYSDGFGEENDDEFVFIDDFYDDFENIKHLRKYRKLSDKKIKKAEYWLITPKAKHALNTQFKRDHRVELHPNLGYVKGERVTVSSAYGSHEFVVHTNFDLRSDCVLITANTVGINYLTPSIVSEEGENACYQEVKVVIERC
ncbi:MAG: molybdopterin-dependent oxidoreductase [Campylobacterota bacterium]|nr:molybdopterin-dependent oxidoreductase [Campylobacterota bacterium]